MQIDACPTRGEISDFLLGRIAESESKRVSTHIQTCPNCADVADALENQSDALVATLRTPAERCEYGAEVECRDALVAIECRESAAALTRAIEQALSDAPRSGAPGTFTAEQVTQILADRKSVV